MLSIKNEDKYLYGIAFNPLNTKYVLPPGKNDRPFSGNLVIWDPMNLVGGSNWSLGSSRFDEISTVALGQCVRMKSWFVDKNPGWNWWQVGKDVVVHVAI